MRFAARFKKRTRPDPAPDRREADRLLVAIARRGGIWLGLLACTALGIAAGETALPAVLGRGVDAALGRAPTIWLTWAVLLVIVLMAVDALDDLVAGGATARSTAWLRRSLLHHVLRLGPATGGRFSSGDLAGRLSGNAADAGRVGPDVVRVGADLLIGLGSVVALALIDPWLAITFLAGVPVLALLARAFARQASATADGYLKVQGTIATRLGEAVSGARTIAASGTLEREVDRILTPLPELRRHGDEMWRQQAWFASLDAILVPLLGVAVLAVAGVELSQGRITPGETLAAAQYALLGSALMSTVTSIGRLARARAGAGRAVEVIGLPPVNYGEMSLPAGGGKLEFQKVTLRMGGRVLLDGVSLTVPPGALFAVVGSSGSGKSLLARLAARLLDPDEGAVLLDGMALPRLRRDVLRRAVACAFERPVLMGDSFAAAIAFGPYEPSPDDVFAASVAAQADEFIRRMPRGYLTPLDAAPISGGETQRVGLARAFAHPGRLLVLDDVAASLDTVTEHEIGRVLTGDLAGRTRLIVAHRASTAARADAVVWLEGGRVRAVAPHQVLWEETEYRGLFEPDADASEAAARVVGGGLA